MKKDSEKTPSVSPAQPAAGQSSSSRQPQDRATRSKNRDQLSKKDAAAGSPADYSVSGEEDPGAGLEALVKRDQ